MEKKVTFGVIGALGDMAKLYVRILSQHPIVSAIHVSDHPSKFTNLELHYADHILSGKVVAHTDGHGVSRASDVIMYSVESSNIVAVIKEYAKSTKVGAIVAGQTSVKADEIAAFEEFMPNDVSIISLHSMHGPTVSTKGQPLVLIPHRVLPFANPHWDSLQVMHVLVEPFQSRTLEMSVQEHDTITADTQAVTHVAFLSMGTAWATVGVYPWLSEVYRGGIEEVKVMVTLRIYFSKWHVYAGLSILNSSARNQIMQFFESARELFELMIQEREVEFRERVLNASKVVFGTLSDKSACTPLLPPDVTTPITPSKPNSHLSILAIVDSWAQLGINPFKHLALLGTPVFRLWLGISQYIFTAPNLLESTIKAALFDKSIRMDDLNFVLAVQQWKEVIAVRSFEGYEERFKNVFDFFVKQKIGSAAMRKRSDELIAKLQN